MDLVQALPTNPEFYALSAFPTQIHAGRERLNMAARDLMAFRDMELVLGSSVGIDRLPLQAACRRDLPE
jgi:hypothetical protein